MNGAFASARARRVVVVPLLLLVATSLACAPVAFVEGFRPEASDAGARSGSIEALDVVLEPDARPFHGRSSLGPGFLALIPLVPYGHQQISPEAGAFSGALKNPDFPEDVQDVLVKDLRSAGFASWVGAPDERLPGDERAGPAYTLHLTVREGIYHRYLTLYGLSLAGAFLWIAGLPTSYGGAELALTIELRDPSGRSLASRDFDSTARRAEWLYYAAPVAYAPTLIEAYEELSPRIRAFVAATLREASPP